MAGLAAESAEHKTTMIDVTYLKGYRTASSPQGKKRARMPDRANQGWDEHQAARCRRCEGGADRVLHVARPPDTPVPGDVLFRDHARRN